MSNPLDQTSIVDLKAELLRKQEEFRLKTLSKSAYNRTQSEYETNKTVSTWGKKTKAKSTKDETSTETVPEEKDEEQERLERSRKMLESKAKYYDEVLSGKNQIDKTDEEVFLVDFDKKIDETKKAEDENFGPSLHLKAEVSESEYNEKLRVKWEKDMQENMEKSSVRYQDIKFNEIRNMGVGNFQFSRDENERQDQLQFFKVIEKEIKYSRLTNELNKLRREKLLLVRLSKIKQRRLIKHGYSMSQISSVLTYDKDIEEVDLEMQTLEQQINNTESIEETDATTSQATQQLYEKRVILDREWDKPKLKEKMWEKHVEKLRSERNKRYAPPKSYDAASKKHDKKPKFSTTASNE